MSNRRSALLPTYCHTRPATIPKCKKPMALLPGQKSNAAAKRSAKALHDRVIAQTKYTNYVRNRDLIKKIERDKILLIEYISTFEYKRLIPISTFSQNAGCSAINVEMIIKLFLAKYNLHVLHLNEIAVAKLQQYFVKKLQKWEYSMFPLNCIE